MNKENKKQDFKGCVNCGCVFDKNGVETSKTELTQQIKYKCPLCKYNNLE